MAIFFGLDDLQKLPIEDTFLVPCFVPFEQISQISLFNFPPSPS